MSDHFVDVTNMVSDTPRTDAAYFEPGATMYDLAGETKRMERELNAANDRIKVLEEVYAATEAVRTINGCWCNNHPDVWIRCSSCCDKKKRYYAAKANLHRTDKAKEAP